jgi:hypothetical protein
LQRRESRKGPDRLPLENARDTLVHAGPANVKGMSPEALGQASGLLGYRKGRLGDRDLATTSTAAR